MEYKNHLGVYGVVEKNNQLLCIRKIKGPYKNRYDLPGGSQVDGEGLTETLSREVKEETGCDVVSINGLDTYDFFVNSEMFDGFIHHIALFYEIEIDENDITNNIDDEAIGGFNDSAGAVFVNINELNIDNSSPLIMKYIEEKLIKKKKYTKTVYNTWKINKDKIADGDIK